MTASLAYRKNTSAILAGNPPEKYTRLLPYIPGEHILEIGSAEGVLACLLAKQGKSVIAVEANTERHKNGPRLAAKWGVSGILFANARIENCLGMLGGIDTVVAVRSIYYLGENLDPVFSEISKSVENVVLCGNKNRAARYRAGLPDEPLGEMNYYASLEGMVDLLERHGYRTVEKSLSGDEIVVGRRL